MVGAIRMHWIMLLLFTTAIGLGVLGAFATAGKSPPKSAAAVATHCTRYNPRTTADVNCFKIAYHPTGLIPDFTTAGWAARDSNEFKLNKANDWQLYYRKHSDGSTFNWKAGFGSSGSIGGSGGIQAFANCHWANYQVANYNECTTTWH